MELSDDELKYEIEERRHNDLINQIVAINLNLQTLAAALTTQTKQLEKFNNQIEKMYDYSTDSLKIKQQ